MTASPLTLRDEPDAAGRFRSDLSALEARWIERWHRTPAPTPELGPRTGWRRRLATGRAARRLIDRLAAEIEHQPEAEGEREAWRRRVEERLREFGRRHLGWPDGYRRLLFADAYYEGSITFARRARAFDPGLGGAEIGQAIRNVWIMNSLQGFLDLEIELTPAVFAYSMLYPETDNYLDDPAVSGAAKRRFSERLGRRLAGETLAAGDPHEDRVFRLVGMIEEQWDRASAPEVYASLLAIHRGQVASLAQQEAGALPDPDRLLALSVAKGGASVLADGYLTAGRLSAAEADFCFGYGVFLQLLDDLQDRERDRAAGHATLFSIARPGPELDRLAARLFRFMERAVERSPRFSPPRYRQRKDLVVRSSKLLFVAAVAAAKRDFTRPFRRALGRRWPLRLAAMPRLERRADRRFRSAMAALCRRRGVDSVLDLL